MKTNNPALQRSLGPVPGTALVIGIVLGTGVFLKSAGMAQAVGSVPMVMLAWILAGVFSFFGALVYAELGARFPEAGGEYVYLREGVSERAAFLYGWTRFWIASPASIAAYAVGSATFLSGVWLPSGALIRQLVAVGLIALFTFLNCFSVAFSGRSQTILTALKALVVVALTSAAFFFGRDSAQVAENLATSWPGPIALGTAILSALWAYDGWNNLPMMAGEIDRPERNVPLSLGVGMFVVTALYLAVNGSYFYALGVGGVASANSTLHPDALPVATKAAATFLGDGAVRLLALTLVLSALGAMNGAILSNSRVPYAMAADGIFFRSLAQLSAKTRVPVRAVIVQGLLSCLLALGGTFDQLTNCVVFVSWIFYATTAAGLFRLRRQGAVTQTTFRAPGFPELPGIFLAGAILLVANTVLTFPVGSLLGLSVIGLGLPAHAYFQRRRFTR